MNLYRRLLNKMYTLWISRKFARCGSSYFFSTVSVVNHAQISIGDDCLFHDDVWLVAQTTPECRGQIEIADNVVFSKGVIVQSAFGIRIGKGATLGPYAMVMDNNHRFDDPHSSVMSQGLAGKSVEIGDNAWLGGHAIVLPGVKIGCGAIVGAGSVVTKSVDPFQIVAGNPARPIRDRREARNRG